MTGFTMDTARRGNDTQEGMTGETWAQALRSEASIRRNSRTRLAPQQVNPFTVNPVAVSANHIGYGL